MIGAVDDDVGLSLSQQYTLDVFLGRALVRVQAQTRNVVVQPHMIATRGDPCGSS